MRRRRRLAHVVHLILFAGWLNIAAFWIVSVAIGGDAMRGRAEGGRYYVRHAHTETEVSRRTWQYSRVHAVSVYITATGMGLGGCLFVYAHLKSKAITSPGSSAPPTR